MTLQTNGQIRISDIKAEFSDINSNQMGDYYNCDPFNDFVPAISVPPSEMEMADFYGADGRTAILYPAEISTRNSSNVRIAPDRYGYGQANRTGYWHPEAGLNTAAFGSISRTRNLIGSNNFCGIVWHKPRDGFSYANDDIHLEIYTKSSSNSGWTTLDFKTGGSKAYAGGSIVYTFTRANADHFGAVAGTSPTTYAWTFVTGNNINWHSTAGYGHSTDSGADVEDSFDTAYNYASNQLSLNLMYLRFS